MIRRNSDETRLEFCGFSLRNTLLKTTLLPGVTIVIAPFYKRVSMILSSVFCMIKPVGYLDNINSGHSSLSKRSVSVLPLLKTGGRILFKTSFTLDFVLSSPPIFSKMFLNDLQIFFPCASALSCMAFRLFCHPSSGSSK